MRNDLGLYLHIPFCMKKCGYCDFLSWKGTREEQENYVQSLIREIESYEAFAKGYKVSTVFLGGGTPSILSGEQMERILGVVSKVFWLEKKPEITVEMNPGTVTEEKLKSYKRAGVNRLSIGLQSVKNENLRLLGRIHTYEEFLQSFDWARQAGFLNINVDLMSAVPKQTLTSYEENLRKIAKLSPEHISAYSLIIEEGTPFYEDNKLEELLPSEEDEVLMYRMTEKILNEYGYDKYEISNYAKPGFESRHNLGYWSHIPYLGVGLNASSYLDEKRFENPSDMKDYLEIQSFGDAYEGARSLSVYEQMEEFMFLGLRKTKGISKKEFIERFGCSMDSVYGKPLIESMKQGMMKEEGDRVFLTQDGTLVSNQVLCEFLFDEEV